MFLDILLFVCLFIIFIFSIKKYLKGIVLIKENNYDSLFFSILPSILFRTFFVSLKIETGKLRWFNEEHEKEFDKREEVIDEIIKKSSNRLQLIVYTLCYILVWCFIVYLTLLIFSKYYVEISLLPDIFLKVCLAICITIFGIRLYVSIKNRR